MSERAAGTKFRARRYHIQRPSRHCMKAGDISRLTIAKNSIPGLRGLSGFPVGPAKLLSRQQQLGIKYENQG